MASATPEGNVEGYSAFIGDLDPAVDDAQLEGYFKTYYPSTRSAKVMLDPQTQRSRGYGFVRFASAQERDRAIVEMNGVFIGNKQVRCSIATARKPTQNPSSITSGGAPSTASSATVGGGETDPNNTTIFVGGLSASVTEAELHATFSRCGELTYVKIPQGKGCGFVQFVKRSAAEYALEHLNGHVLGGMAIRLSWGRSAKPPPMGGTHQPSAAAHPYAPGYFPGPAGYAGDYYGSGAYGGAYGVAYDPYAYAYGMDPYAAYAHGYGMAPGAAYGGMAAAAAAGAAAAAHGTPHPGAPGALQPVMLDPMAPVNVDKMNMAYMHRHIPVLTGGYVRVPIIPMPPPHMGAAPPQMGGHMQQQ